MRIQTVITFVLLFLTACGQETFDKPLSPRLANYSIQCSFSPDEKVVRGKEKLLWVNSSFDSIQTLQFHLYMNAFRNERATFWKEAGFFPAQVRAHPGYIDITSVSVDGETNLRDRLALIHPDDDNTADRTVAELRLPEAVPPHDSVTVYFEFETRLPPLTERAGFDGDYVIVSQWFPKIAVYENGAWNAHQYHYNSEFYADFGNYRVEITLPDSFTVAATGELRQSSSVSAHGKKYLFYANDVHDFAWAASPDLSASVIPFKKLNIRLYLLPQHKNLAGRFVEAAKNAYTYCAETYGDYPYSQISIVDTPVFNTVMEYPMLFFTGNFASNDSAYARETLVGPDNLFPERLTMHEFAHSWWYGMCANNEFEDAWLDEGFAEFTTTRAFESAYGPTLFTNRQGEKVDIRAFQKDKFLRHPGVIVHAPAWEHPSYDEYYIASYIKPKLLLQTLNNYFGDEVWDRVMRTYFQRWKFQHPGTQDFVTTVREVTGADWITGFLRQYLETRDVLDYAVQTVNKNVATIVNRGTLYFPVQIVVRFTDGSEERVLWQDFQLTEYELSFPGKGAIKQIAIDPDNSIEFEIDRHNNFWHSPAS